MNRINWIDWTKAVAVITVVYCHLPQQADSFYFRYLQAGVITLFFFVSGYLKKDRGSAAGNWRKYWRGLILPYLLYNLVFLPYWVLRFYLQTGAMPGVGDVMRPVLGALLLEHSGSFCEVLNGPLWYLPSILILHVITDLFHRSRHAFSIIAVLCIASFFLYYAYRYYDLPRSMTPMGTIRRLPYYYLGYVMGRLGLFRETKWGRDLLLTVVSLALSILVFHWHVQETRLLPHIAWFYPFNLCFLFTVLCGCRLLNGYAPRWMVNLSIGTLVIIGLHWIVIGCVNHALMPLLGMEGQACYTWYEALPVTAFVVAVLYPVILFGRKHMPVLVGK